MSPGQTARPKIGLAVAGVHTESMEQKEFCIVTPPCGAVRGSIERGMKVFRGVPYASAERFCVPEKRTWDGVADALVFGQCCPQGRAYYDESVLSPFYYNEFRRGLSFAYGEDCLRLNVFAPVDAQKSPVLVFLHGGAFAHGSSDELPFDGEEICKRGVTLVTVNYRLNVFGFVSDGSVPYNLGLHDQIAALRWVNENISAFGGDPDNVTLSGQSAGAISTQILALDDGVKALVKRVFMMSGGGFVKGVFRPHNARLTARLAEKTVRCAGVQSFAELKTLGAKELFDAWNKAFNSSPLMQLAVLPAMDGVIARKERYESFGRDGQLPALIGVTSEDLIAPLMRSAAKSYAVKSPADCWQYMFSKEPPGGGRKGAWHSSDLWYVFGTLSRSHRPFGEDDRELSRRMTDAVCAFARDGVPRTDGAPWGRAPYYREYFP